MPPYEKMFFTIAISTKIFFAGPKGILNPLGPSHWVFLENTFRDFLQKVWDLGKEGYKFRTPDYKRRSRKAPPKGIHNPVGGFT